MRNVPSVAQATADLKNARRAERAASDKVNTVGAALVAAERDFVQARSLVERLEERLLLPVREEVAGESESNLVA